MAAGLSFDEQKQNWDQYPYNMALCLSFDEQSCRLYIDNNPEILEI